MAGLKNKIMPFLSVSVILSVLLHITVLTALPFFKGFLSFAPLVPDVMVIEFQDGMQPGKMGPKAPSVLSLQGKESRQEKPGENILSRELREKNLEAPNKDDAALDSEDASDLKASADSLTPEIIACNKAANTGIKIGESETNRKELQMARSARERFAYDIYWLGIHVGNASLEAVNDNGLLKITSRANSSGFISAFYKVEDYAESLIWEGTPVHFRIKQHEGKYRSDKETIFDAGNKNIMFVNYLKGTKKEHPVANGIAWDVISGFYYLRTQPIEIGKIIHINIFDSNKFYKAEINVLKKERVEVPGIGEVGAVIVRPELKTEGLFQKKGDVLIWLTDDEKRIPVRVETKVPIGDIVAKLKDFAIEQ